MFDFGFFSLMCGVGLCHGGGCGLVMGWFGNNTRCRSSALLLMSGRGCGGLECLYEVDSLAEDFGNGL